MKRLNRNIITKESMDDASDDGYVADTPEYRVGIMWDITRDAWAFMKNGDAERRLQRDVITKIFS